MIRIVFFDDDGFLTPIEVVRLAGALGEFVTETEAKHLASSSASGRIDFNTFVTWWQDGDDEIDEEDILRFSSKHFDEDTVHFPPVDRKSSGCFWGNVAQDSDDKNDDDEGHTDADGFVLETEDGVEAYKEFKGTKTGSIELGVGDTLHFMVHFLDKDGKEIEHDEDGHDDHGHDDHGDEEDGVRVSEIGRAHV